MFCLYFLVKVFLIGALYAKNLCKIDIDRIRRLVVRPLSRDDISFGKRKRQSAVESSASTRSSNHDRLIWPIAEAEYIASTYVDPCFQIN